MGPNDQPAKCVRLDDDKKRRESADSGTSSVDHIHRIESPGSHRKSESDSGREETPTDDIRLQKPRSSNPHSVMNLVGNANTSCHTGSSSPGSSGIPNPSAFSNPSLHSAAVHHRNLQAAAAQAMQYQSILPGLQFPLGIHSLLSQQINPLLVPHYNPIFQARQNNPLSKFFIYISPKKKIVFQ